MSRGGRRSRVAVGLLLPLLWLALPADAADVPDLVAGVFSPPRAAPDFALRGSDGTELKLSHYRGKLVILAFGFTACPDVCPTTLSDMARTMQILGPDAERVQVLFVTIDPKRDTAELLKQYVPAFNPNFLGLRGDAAATAKVTKDFKIYAQERAGKTPDSYTMDHSAQMLVFDPKGRVRLVFGYGMEPEKMAADLKVLLNS